MLVIGSSRCGCRLMWSCNDYHLQTQSTGATPRVRMGIVKVLLAAAQAAARIENEKECIVNAVRHSNIKSKRSEKIFGGENLLYYLYSSSMPATEVR